MTYSPAEVSLDDPVFVNTFTGSSVGTWMHSLRFGAPSSVVWPTTQCAFYIPFWLNAPYLIQRFWWMNGTTVGTDNFQVGVYDEDFNLLVSCTSTLSAGASAVQYVTPGSPVALPKMRGYLALWGSGTTAHIFATGAAEQNKSQTYRQASLASGLPSTATPGTNTSLRSWMFGFTRRSSP